MPEIRKIILVFLSCILFFCMTGCSDSTPEISTVQNSLILDYKTADSLPVQRFSFFVSVDEINRTEKIRLLNTETGIEWNVIEPRIIYSTDSKNYTGYTNLVPVSGEAFPEGHYKVFYENAAEKECTAGFFLEYDKDLLNVTADKFPDAIKKRYVENYAVYASDGTLLYYGKKKKNWNDLSAIRGDYMLADSVRKCYTINKTVVCMMPVEKIQGLNAKKKQTSTPNPAELGLMKIMEQKEQEAVNEIEYKSMTKLRQETDIKDNQLQKEEYKANAVNEANAMNSAKADIN